MEASLDSHDLERGTMGPDCARTAGQSWRSRRHGAGRSAFVEAVLWIARTGAPWRDLPQEFGNWFTVYTRFWRWAQKGVWERVFNVLSDDPDFECVLLDATHVRVHQHGTGAKGDFASRPSARRVAV